MGPTGLAKQYLWLWIPPCQLIQAGANLKYHSQLAELSVSQLAFILRLKYPCPHIERNSARGLVSYGYIMIFRTEELDTHVGRGTSARSIANHTQRSDKITANYRGPNRRGSLKTYQDTGFMNVRVRHLRGQMLTDRSFPSFLSVSDLCIFSPLFL